MRKEACVNDSEQKSSQPDFQIKQDLGHKSDRERRKAVRFDIFFAMPTLKNINRADGLEVNMINMSRHGALIDSPVQMAQDSSIILRVITEETTYIIKGRITHCRVSSKNDKLFLSGIEFNQDFTPLPANVELLKLFEDDEREVLELLLPVIKSVSDS
jgi:hypothetical protein